MIEAPIPENEQQRLAALRKLHLLDTPMEERFERIIRLARMALGVPISAFSLVDETRQWFKSVQGMDVRQTSRGVSFCGHAILGDEMLVVPDAAHDVRFAGNPLVTGAPHIGFYAGYPIHATNGEKIGTLCAIDTKPRQLTEENTQSLRDLALMLETELRVEVLSEAQEELILELDAAQRLALIDSLTHLWNRGGVFELLRREWSKAARNKTPIALVVADIDHFKLINDTHGHPIGDVVLQDVARRLLGSLRLEDAVGRLGGEEFLLILPGCEAEQLQSAVERIRAAVNDSPIATAAGFLNVTISYGACAAIPEPAISVEKLIKQADDALYMAKRSGRNRVEVAA